MSKQEHQGSPHPWQRGAGGLPVSIQRYGGKGCGRGSGGELTPARGAKVSPSAGDLERGVTHGSSKRWSGALALAVSGGLNKTRQAKGEKPLGPLQEGE